MKKIGKVAFLAAIASIATGGLLNVSSASAAQFKDYSEMPSVLSKEYSYARLYYANDTKITLVKSDNNENNQQSFVGQDIVEGKYYYNGANQALTVLVENSTAIDPNGNLVDVIIKLDDTIVWRDATTYSDRAYFYLDNTIYGLPEGHDNNTYPSANPAGKKLMAGDPIIFWVGEEHALDARLTIKYCQKGSYDSTKNDCAAAPGLDRISVMVYDFDVSRIHRDGANKDVVGGDYSNRYFEGSESVSSLGGDSAVVYYNTNIPTETAKETNNHNFLVIDKGINGVAINPAVDKNAQNFDGIWHGNSIMVTSPMNDASYSLRHSGLACGTAIIIGASVSYEMVPPTKYVDKGMANIGDTLKYDIKQVVPENYNSESDIMAFESLQKKYSNINEKVKYNRFTIADTFEDDLQLPDASTVVITNANGKDITSLFTVKIDGQTLTAMANTDENNFMDIYGQTITVTINTVIKETDKTAIYNDAKTIYTPADSDKPVELPSNEVVTVLVENPKTDDKDLLIFFVMFGASTAGSAMLLAKSIKRR